MAMARLAFWRDAVWRRAWGIVMLIWTIFANGTTVRDNFLPKSLQEQLQALDYLPKLGWRDWLIGFLIILLIALAEGSFRLWQDERKKYLAAICEKDNIERKYYDQRPVLGLDIVFSDSLAEFSLVHLSGRPAVNVRIDPIYSLKRNCQLYFHDLPFVRPGHPKRPLSFYVQYGETKDSVTSNLIKSIGWQGILRGFLLEAPEEIDEAFYEMTLRFRDEDEERIQRFKMAFDTRINHGRIVVD
jgi:hypothetical protein